jgi:hypothetical protein
MRSPFLALIMFASVLGFAQTDSAVRTGASPDPVGLSQEQMKNIIRQSADKDLENDKKQRDYTYTERQEEQRLDGKGQVKSTETKTYDVMDIYDEQVQKLVAKDDQPLSEKDAKKEDDKIQKLIDKRKNESDSDREKRIKKEEKEHEEDRQFVREVADAYDLKFAGIETIEGRENYMIDGDPKPGYQPHSKQGDILRKTRFRVWIDKDDLQVKKLDVLTLETISWGLFVARIHKGSRILIETTRVNNEVWLQQHVALKVDVRLALMKDFNVNVDITDRDYKKFRTDTKVIPLGDAR